MQSNVMTVKEYWDILDSFRKYTGKSHIRGEQLDGQSYHQVGHIWIYNSKGEWLIQRRAPDKEGWPNMWDCAAAGSVTIGENPIKGILREAQEEIGLNLTYTHLRRIFTIKFERGFDDVWLAKLDKPIDEFKVDGVEVCDIKWASSEEIINLLEMGAFIPYSFLFKLFEASKEKIIISMNKAHLVERDFKSYTDNFYPCCYHVHYDIKGEHIHGFDIFLEEIEPGEVRIRPLGKDVVEQLEMHYGDIQKAKRYIWKRLEYLHPEVRHFYYEDKKISNVNYIEAL